MNQLDWLLQHRFQSLTRREYDWIFAFDAEIRLIATCLWRLVEARRIHITSLDDGHQFGLPTPMDAVAELTARLANRVIVAVDLHEGTLDLRIQFDTGHVLEIIPESAGYEAWNIQRLNQQFIAVGGGNLTILGT